MYHDLYIIHWTAEIRAFCKDLFYETALPLRHVMKCHRVAGRALWEAEVNLCFVFAS